MKQPPMRSWTPPLSMKAAAKFALLAASLSLLAVSPARADEAREVQRLLALSNAGAALQRVDAALAALRDSGRTDARLVFLRGVVLMDLKRDDDALAVFTTMTQDYPQLAEPWNNIAALHARAGRWDSARLALESALRNDPSHRLARENLGDVYLQLALNAWRGAQAPAQPNPDLQRKIRHGTALAERNGG